MRVVVRTLKRWAWIPVVCLVSGWLLGSQLAVLIPPMYQATAIVHLNAQARVGVGAQVVQSVAAYATIVTSDAVLGNVLKKYPRLSRQLLGKQVSVSSDNNGQNVILSVTLPRPKEAASLANDLASLLVAQQNTVIKLSYDKQLKLLNETISNEQKQIDLLNQKITQTPTSNMAQIQSLQEQRNQVQNLQSQNIADRDDLLTQQALYSDPLSLMQAATPPPRPATILGQIPMVPATMCVFLILGIVAIFALEQWADRITSGHTLQQKVVLPLFGTLRWTTPDPQEMPLRAFCEVKQPYVEECRVMMADILFRAEQAQARVLAITALKPRAGTSTIAAQLAALLAQSRRRVLLIDANLHRPSLHERLEVRNEAGLARLLEEVRMKKMMVSSGGVEQAVNLLDKVPIDTFILPSPVQNLYVLPAGRPSVNPASLLSMPEMEQFLKWAARRSDYIILDCPALTFGEVHVLGSLSDQAYIVIDATRDKVKQVVAIKDELMGSSVKLSGLIVNKLDR
jgi:Mrp family chromosome partitioning ATPase/capsular polysaccharide biosynthesis protein